MTDTEIYIDGHATAHFRDMNEALEDQRLALIGKHRHADGDLYSETLLAAQIEEEDFFCHVTHKTWDAIDVYKRQGVGRTPVSIGAGDGNNQTVP